MNFTWDDRKNRSNKKKHHVGFELASLVFEDPNHLSRMDREVEGETRWQTLGLVEGAQILLVAHTVIEEGEEETIRIISVRKATRMERKIYAEGK